MILLWVILWVLAALLALVLLFVILTAVPIRYSLRSSYDGEATVMFKVSYLLKLVRYKYEYKNGEGFSDLRILFFKINPEKSHMLRSVFTIPEEIKEPQRPAPQAAPTKACEKPKPKMKKESQSLYRVLTDTHGKTMIKQIFTAIKKIFHIVRPKHIEVTGTIGLSCPFDTAMLLGAYESLASIFNVRKQVRLVPDFNTEIVKLNADVRGKVNIFRISISLIQMIKDKPMWKFILELINV